MYTEILILGIIIFFLLNYSGRISSRRFIEDNQDVFLKLKEEDYDFYVQAKYGDQVDPNILFNTRIRNGLIVIAAFLFLFLTGLDYVKILFSLLAGFLVFKLDYLNLRTYYKKHLHDIDLMLPYYLKNLEILIQHYTVPVAIGRSIDDAPTIFKEGLKELIYAINSGDSTIDPYMNFAKKYPVRDSMRMMRLLYRLGIGRQERKQEQLLAFSRTISTLQQKSRETKYKERLEKMEKKTMSMLITTGVGVMVLLVLSLLMMFSI